MEQKSAAVTIDDGSDIPEPLPDDDVGTKTVANTASKGSLHDNLQAIVASKGFSVLMMTMTIYALFGDDLRLLASEKPDDAIFFGISTVALVCFTVEVALNVFVKPGYPLGFYFWLDFLSTLSLVPDIGWMWDPIVGNDDSGGSQSAALKAGRASRVGTKAGRVVRIVRLVRMVRIVKLYKMTAKGEDVDLEEDASSEPSKVGKKLTELTTRRVICIVLIMILMLPILDQSVLQEDYDPYQDFGLQQLHRMSSPYYNYTPAVSNRSLVSTEVLKYKIKEYVRNAGVLMHLKLCGDHGLGDAEGVLTGQSWITDMKFQSDVTKTYTESVNPINGWDPSKHITSVSEIRRRYRSDEVLYAGIGTAYERRGPTLTLFEVFDSNCTSEAFFSNKHNTAHRAALGIGKTLVVMVILTLGVMAFTNDAAHLVIEPIERMMSTVTRLARNPLGSTEDRGPKVGSAEAAEKHGYETMLLEKTLKKIGGLLQVGFGAAGSEIIGKNMSVDGDLDAMVPGKLITSVFGFCIIEDFTETCSYLGADITRYINTVAMMVHSNVHNYYGAANKNIGCAFLMAWKICDGRLYGLRDPRDPDQSRLPAEDLRRGRSSITISKKGAGTATADLMPQDIIDAALISFVKCHYDVHNANRSGGRFAQFNEVLRQKAVSGEVDPDDVETFREFQVHMGFGMHIGWAIEGAIGSRFKIDASYLSPNVNMSARLEAATHQFGCPILLSEWFVSELSPAARSQCRMIDRICVVGSKIPMEIWTVDVFNYDIHNFLEPSIDADGTQQKVDWDSHPHIRQMKSGMTDGWSAIFNKGVHAYLSGDWPAAIASIESALKMNPSDGPSKSLLKQMAARGNVAPDDWIREGDSRGFRQLTSK